MYRSIDDQSITTQTSFMDWHRRPARYLSDHPPFLGTGQTIPTQSSQRNCTCTRITHLPVIASPCHNVYARRPGRGLTEYKAHR